MAAVVIFNFSFYDVTTDKVIRSRRMGRRDAIARIRGIIDEESGVEVDDSALDSEIEGLTRIGYEPVPFVGGFPTGTKKLL